LWPVQRSTPLRQKAAAFVNDNCIELLLRKLRECAAEPCVVDLQHQLISQHDPQMLAYFTIRRFRARVPHARHQESDLGDRGYRLSQDLQALAKDFNSRIDADDSKVTAGGARDP
jgi:hypothetical protein